MKREKILKIFMKKKIISLSEKTKQIDVLKPKYQKEIKTIVDELEKFKPTIIAVERIPKHQERYDSLYTAYKKDIHKLTRSE